MSKEEAPEAQGAPVKSGLTRKDRLTLTLSSLALLLSLTSLVWTRIDKSLESRVEATRSSFAAFELGRRTASAYWAHLLANQGDQAEIEEARRAFLQFAKDAQQYAISLDIRQDVSTLIERCAIVNANSCLESPEVSIRSRIVGVAGVRAADVFTLAYNLSALQFVSRAAAEGDSSRLQSFRSDFKQYFTDSNALLKKLGYKARVPVEPQSAEVVTEAAGAGLMEVAQALAGDA